MSYGTGIINNGASANAPLGKYLTRGGILGRTAGNNGNLTITCWVNFSVIGAGGTLVSISDGDNSTYIGFDIRVRSDLGTKGFGFNRGKLCTANEINLIDFTTNTSTFYFVCLTWNGTTLTPYINGTAQSTSAPSGNGGSCGAAETTVGNSTGDAPVFIIDEIGFWDRALSGAEITSLYNGGVGLQYPFTSSALQTVDGLAYASVKTVDGLVSASIKNINGLA